MKKHLLFLTALLVACCASAQTSKVGSLHIRGKAGGSATTQTDPSRPPILNVVGEVSFVEPSGNGAIDAGEACKIQMTVQNTGYGPARGLKATLNGSGDTQGIEMRTVDVADIPVNGSRTIEIPLKAGFATKDGSIHLEASIVEPNGFGTETYRFDIETRAFMAPLVKVVGYTTISNDARVFTLEKKKPFDLEILVQNVKSGKADDVAIDLTLPANVTLLDGDAHLSHLTLSSGEAKSIKYSLIVNQQYQQESIPITVAIKERYGRYAEDWNHSLQLNQRMGSTIQVPTTKEERPSIIPGTMGSDVDKDIPQSKTRNNNTFVLIIGNGHYQYESDIATAGNDSQIMQEYCRLTLGVPDRNITLAQDQTLNQMRLKVSEFAKTMELFPDARYLVFYYGHGITDADSKDTYLIPTDGSSKHVTSTCYRRGEMLDVLSRNKTAGTLVVMESCFSGSKPDDRMLSYGTESSGTRIVPREDVGLGNLVLISASSGAQTANAYPSEGHNLFTYCLMKALKETRGEATLGELFDRASKETRQTSHLELHRDQDPVVLAGAAVGNGWKKWTLK